jgi:hypothetical protein
VKSLNKNTKSWKNKDLMKLIKEKDKFYRKWKTNDSQVHRSHDKSIGKKLKKKLFVDSFEHCHDSGSFCKAFNFLSGRSFKEEIPSFMNTDGSVGSLNEEK